MDNVLTPPPCQGSDKPAELTFAKALDIFRDSAWEALVLAFLVSLFGGIALGFVGGLWRDMAPSLPPPLAHHRHAAAGSGSALDFTFFSQHRFALLFALLFIGKSTARLAGHSRNEGRRQTVARLQWILGRVSHQWFSLVVVNAFAAFVAVLVLQISLEFSWTQLLWQMLREVCRPVIHSVASVLPGGGGLGLLSSLADWYGENQFKFLFWLFYSAAICDDLGLPNYKTLGRLLWRRLRKRAMNSGGAKAEGC